MKDEDERPIEDNEADQWEPVPIDTPKASAVLSVRFSDEELRRIRDRAKELGTSLGEVVRNAVNSALGRRPFRFVWHEPAPGTLGSFGEGKQIDPPLTRDDPLYEATG